MTGLDHLARELGELEAAQLLRTPTDEQARADVAAAAASLGVAPIDACSNDYLGFAARGVSRATLDKCGGLSAGAGASRLIHGTREPIPELERELADWAGQPAALLVSSGYAANVGVLAALASREDLIVSDALNHASIIDGCRLSRARVEVVAHRDIAAVEAALARAPERRRWVVTESYFSMDADTPDLVALRTLCDRFNAALVVDEAHAIGVFGTDGCGRLRERGVAADVTIGTLGKAIGAQGAFVAGSETLRSYLWNRARSFVFSTGFSPVLATIVLDHVREARADAAARERVHGHARRLRRALTQSGISYLGDEGPIVPVCFDTAERCAAAARELARVGILAQAIRPPTVPGGARLRITVTAGMGQPDVTRLADQLVAVCRASSF